MRLVQFNSGFYTRPILRCLQAMDSVPLTEELVLGGEPQHLAYGTTAPRFVAQVGLS